MNRLYSDFASAVQFLTRIPMPGQPYRNDSLQRAVKFFPVVGLLIGATAAALYLLLDPHLPRLVTAILVVIFIVSITGCFHEDALADAADGFGGGWTREQVLEILRDSRIGSYGGTALALSLLSRTVLLSSLSHAEILPVLISAHVLCRWTTLPLSYFFSPARLEALDGQGARIANLTSFGTLVGGSIFAFAVTAFLLRWQAVTALALAIILTAGTGMYYKLRIGGVTGDCFGATNQLTEIAIYLCGVWHR